jgi:2-dehydropantoate 2-reductase
MIVTGEFGGWPEPRTHDIAAAFRSAGVPCKVTADLARAHWEKLVWNIPFNGLGVAGVAGYEAVICGKLSRAQPANRCVTTDKLLADPKWAALVRGLMDEVIDASRALGFRIQKSLAEIQINRTLSMGEYRASTLLDYERGLPLELETLFLEPLRRAKAAGEDMPILKNLCKVLAALEKRRAGQ